MGKRTLLAAAAVMLIAGVALLRLVQGPAAPGEAKRSAVLALESPVVSHTAASARAAVPPPPSAPRDSPAADPDPAAAALATPEENARMERMASNLQDELLVDTTTALRMRSEMLARYAVESDPLVRMEIVTELSRLDSVETIRELTHLLREESDSRVREQIVLILGFMRSTPAEMEAVAAVASAVYQASDTPRERQRVIEALGSVPVQETAELMLDIFSQGGAPPAERFAAAEALYRLSVSGVATDPALLADVTRQLRESAQSAAKPESRLAAIRALAAPGQNNRTFLAQLRPAETDPAIREFLDLATQEFPTR